MKRVGIAILICLLIASILSGCFTKDQNNKTENDITIEESRKSSKDKSEKEEKEIQKNMGIFVGDRAYDITLLDKEGNEIKLSDLKDKIVLLNFWTTWCDMCVEQMSIFKEIYEEYKENDIVILAINVLAAEKIDMKEVNLFLDENDCTLPVLYDIDGSATNKYRISKFPTTYIIDQKGMIYDLVVGPVKKSDIIKKVESLLSK